jgi:hypothetical protein
MYISCINSKKINFFFRTLKKPYFPWKKTVHFKRGTKSFGKHNEFEALVQVKQTVHHSETTARSKFPKKKGKSVVDPSGGGETAGILVFVQTANWIPVLTKFRKGIPLRIKSFHSSLKLLKCFHKLQKQFGVRFPTQTSQLSTTRPNECNRSVGCAR